MSSCVYIPHVKVNENFEPSKLWGLILKYVKKDRAKAKELYAIATDSSIIEMLENKNDYVTNEQGLITLACLLRNIEESVDMDFVKSELNDYKYVDYNKALDKMLQINRDWFSKKSGVDYMATLIPNKQDPNTYSVEIVERTDREVEKLENVIANRSIYDRLTFYCNEHGINIGTIFDPDSPYLSIYDPTSNHRAENDLITLIKLANKDMDENTKVRALTESVGLFAIGSTLNLPLTQRLLSLLENNQDLVDYLSSLYLPYKADSSDRTDLVLLAGSLVSDSLSAEVDLQSKLGVFFNRVSALINRIKNYILNVYKYKGPKKIAHARGLNKLQRQIDEARRQSVEIARGFMSLVNYSGSIEETLQESDLFGVKDDLKQQPISSLNTKVYNSVVTSLLNIATLLNAIPNSTATDINAIRALGIKAYNADPSVLEELAALSAIALMVEELQNLLISVQERIVEIEDRAAYFDKNNIPEYANSIKLSHVILKSVLDIMQTIEQFVPYLDSQLGGISLSRDLLNITYVHPSTNNIIHVDLYSVLYQTRITVDSQLDLLSKKQMFLVTKFLEELIGGSSIKIATRRLFKTPFKDDFSGGLLKTVEGEKDGISIEDIIRKHSADTNFWERWFCSSSHQDLMMQYLDMHYKRTEKTTNENIRKDRNTLIDLLSRWDEVFEGRRTNIVYETHETDNYFFNEETRVILDRDEYNALPGQEKEKFKLMQGRLSGSFRILTHYTAGKEGSLNASFSSGEYGINMGDFELAKEHFELKTRRDFMSEYSEEIKNWSDIRKAEEFDAYRNKRYKEWVKIHCEIWKNGFRTEVKPSRHLYRYKEDGLNAAFITEIINNTAKKELYRDIFSFKQRMDSRLSKNAAVPHRIPLFNTTTIWDGMRNREYMGTSIWDRGARLKDYVITKIRDAIVGTVEDVEYGSLDTYNTENEMTYKDSYIYRLDKVNRLPLYGINKVKHVDNLSTNLFHNLMSYSVMSNTYLGVSSNVSMYETVGDVLTLHAKTEDGNPWAGTHSYASFLEFKDKAIYRKNLYIAGYMVINKVASFLTRLASRYYLGGNIQGAQTNFGTAFIELFKEAACGQFITLKNFKNAFYYFTKHIAPCMADYINDYAKSELGQFMEMVDYAGDFKYQMLDYNRHHKKIFNKISRAFDVSNILMLAYKTGDYLIQAVGYLSIFDNTTVYDGNGKPINLLSLWRDYVKLGKGKELLHDLRMGIIPYYKTNDAKSIANYKLANEALNTLSLKNEDELMDYATTVLLSLEYKLLFLSVGYDVSNVALYGTEQLVTALKDIVDSYIWTDKDTSNLIEKARTMTIRMHGIYNQYDQVRSSLYLIGDLFLQMKGYLLGMAVRRFGANRFNVTTGTDLEGSELTMIKILLDLNIKDSYNTSMGIIQRLGFILCPFINKDHKKIILNRAGYSDSLVANLTRNIGDYMAIALMFTLKTIAYNMIHGWDDEDKEKKKEAEELAKLYGEEADFFSSETVWQGLYYLFSRLLSEQAAFNVPRRTLKEGEAMLALPVAVSSALDIMEFCRLYSGYYKPGGPALNDVSKYDSEEEFLEKHSEVLYQKDSRYFEKGDPKYYKYITKVPFLRYYYAMIDGEEAAKSWEFTRSR